MAEKKIESFTGDTAEVTRLRREINSALDHGHTVKVKLWQPGIMYQQDGQWLSVINFINEWAGQDVQFFSNLVPLRETTSVLTYTNDMFISGHRLYLEDDLCRSLRKKLVKDVSSPRKYHWDLLLGQHRPFKDQLYDQIKQHEVVDKCFLTYMPKGQCVWSHGHVPKQHTAETIGDSFANPRISDLIDPEIYNQTYYSCVVETVNHPDFAMFSEKFAKPIMARRPFVVFGSPRHLEAFRSLGFKTFNSVMDENYDLIDDRDERFQAVLDTMNALSTMDAKEVYDKLHDVLQHNFDHFLDTNWAKIIDETTEGSRSDV